MGLPLERKSHYSLVGARGFEPPTSRTRTVEHELLFYNSQIVNAMSPKSRSWAKLFDMKRQCRNLLKWLFLPNH